MDYVLGVGGFDLENVEKELNVTLGWVGCARDLGPMFDRVDRGLGGGSKGRGFVCRGWCVHRACIHGQM